MKANGKGKRSRVLLVLALIALATSLATSGTLAKYASTFGYQIGTQVAAFAAGGGTVDIDVALTDIVPGTFVSDTIPFEVCNFEGDTLCDVQMQYQIKIQTTGNLPLIYSLRGEKYRVENGAEVKDAGDSSSLVGTLDSETMTAVGGVLPVASQDGEDFGKRIHRYQLIVKWPDDEKDERYSEEIDDVTVTVTAVQVDPRASA